MKPHIAIAIPVKNSLDGLIYSIESLLLQKALDQINLVVFVVDNQSNDKDDVKALVEKLASESKLNIKYILNEEPLGRVQNWNKCLSVLVSSEAAYGKLLFSGDTLESDCLLNQMAMLAMPWVSFTTGMHEVIPDEEGVSSYAMMHFDADTIFPSENSLKLSLLKGNWFAGSVALPLFRIEAIKGLYFDEKLEWASDWKFWAELAAKGHVCYQNKVLTKFYMKYRKGYKHLAGTNQAFVEDNYVKEFIAIKLQGLSNEAKV